MYLWSELHLRTLRIHNLRDFPVRPGVKNPPCNAGNVSLIPGQGTSGSAGKESACNAGGLQKHRFNPWVRKAPWRKKWQPTPVFLPGKSHGQRSLAGYSPWGRKESDVTEHTEVCGMSLSYWKASYYPCTDNLFLLKRVCVYVWGRERMDMHDFTYYCQQLMA